WARPAVRYGPPAVAVVLVAIVWVAVEQPVPTRVPPPPARTTAAREIAQPPVAPPSPAPMRELAPQAKLRDSRVLAPSPGVGGAVHARGGRADEERQVDGLRVATPPAALKKESDATGAAGGAPEPTSLRGGTPSASAPAAPVPPPAPEANRAPSASWGTTKSTYKGLNELAPQSENRARLLAGTSQVTPPVELQAAGTGSVLSTVAARITRRPPQV